MRSSAIAELLDQRILPDAVTTLFTAGLRTEITVVVVSKLATTGEPTATLYHVPDGQSQGDQHQIAVSTHGLVLQSDGPGTGVTLGPGDKLMAKASATGGLTMAVYGVTESVV